MPGYVLHRTEPGRALRHATGMKYVRHLVAASALAGLAAVAGAQPASAPETLKIQYLISAIDSLKDAAFFRNGVAYGSKSAADHLRLKWRLAGSRCTTAEGFIHYCASASSVTGLPYSIRFADGHTVTSEIFLRRELSAYQAAGLTGG